MAKKLFVGGLSWDTTDTKLSEFFSQAGAVLSANVIIDRLSGKSKGFGFVEMATDGEAEEAKQKLNGQNLDGRAIFVSDARPQQPRENTYSGGFGGRDNRDRRGRGDRPHKRY